MKIKELVQCTTDYLAKHNIPSPRLDAEVLLSYLLKKERIFLYLNWDSILTQHTLDIFRKLVLERSKHIPIAYLTGYKEFMSIDFEVNEKVLIPRPETEALVEATLSRMLSGQPNREWLAIDMGTGCGNIAVALAKSQNIRIYASDISEDALNISKKNAEKNKVEKSIRFLCGDLFKSFNGLNLAEKIDFIVSNPPYVSSADFEKLPIDIKQYEPRIALDGGTDGIDFYPELVKGAEEFLKPNGFLIMEIGYGQVEGIKKLISSRGTFFAPEIVRDYGGIERVIICTRHS
ncbi:MAG: peptide chain release factor N(5)-glutamine methyltransferase [bacterium]|nr:peptide chain release factor N(5)-glutamine methyltransferase [bacterium]